jgi:hypothetical protein
MFSFLLAHFLSLISFFNTHSPQFFPSFSRTLLKPP